MNHLFSTNLYPELQGYPLNVNIQEDSSEFCVTMIKQYTETRLNDLKTTWNNIFDSNPNEISDFGKVRSVFKLPNVEIIWLNEFGCAIIIPIIQKDFISSPYVAFPDGWETSVCYGKEHTVHVAVPNEYGRCFSVVLENTDD